MIVVWRVCRKAERAEMIAWIMYHSRHGGPVSIYNNIYLLFSWNFYNKYVYLEKFCTFAIRLGLSCRECMA